MRLMTTIDISEPLRTLDAIGDGVKDRKVVLRRINNYLRARTFTHFREEKGWAPLAKSTEAHKGTLFEGSTGTVDDRNRLRAEASVRAKLAKDLRRAERRFSEKAIAKKKALLSEYEEYVQSRAQGAVTGPDTKTLSKTKERLGRAEERAGRKLGRLRAGIVSEIDEAGLTLKNRIPWAGVHNEGGAAGHGAKIPARPFLFLESEDEKQCATIIENYVQELISGSAK